MMDHPAEAWEHGTFKDVATKVANLDLFYKAVVFYLDNHPDLVNDLLRVLEPRIDNGRVVDLLRKRGQLPLIKDYLLSVQKVNQAPVNEALNDLFIEEGDHVGLKESISTHDNFDQLTLAARLEKHETLAFRRLAILLYKKNNRWRQVRSPYPFLYSYSYSYSLQLEERLNAVPTPMHFLLSSCSFILSLASQNSFWTRTKSTHTDDPTQNTDQNIVMTCFI